MGGATAFVKKLTIGTRSVCRQTMNSCSRLQKLAHPNQHSEALKCTVHIRRIRCYCKKCKFWTNYDKPPSLARVGCKCILRHELHYSCAGSKYWCWSCMHLWIRHIHHASN